MASISKHHGGWMLRFMRDGKRLAFYPGPMPKRDAHTFKRHVENLLSAKLQGTAVCDETSSWLRRQDRAMRLKLHAAGIAEAPIEVKSSLTVDDWVSRYIAERGDVKDSTKIVWRRFLRLIRASGMAELPLDEFSIGHAKDFRQWMLREGRQQANGTPGLGENTTRKMCSVACQFFADALDRDLIGKNPFDRKDIPRTTKENRTRDHFISRETAAAVLDACPDAEWRLLFALSRYGGLRCPSEHLALRWRDVHWDKGRMLVTAPKTEHHEGKGTRWVPLFPELLPYLRDAWEAAPVGAEFVITRSRDSSINLRTQFERILAFAGIEPWPKLWHNLRATRQTELQEEFPIHVVCSWLGNSPRVANAHYLQVTDEHFERAADARHYARQKEAEQSGTLVNSEKAKRRNHQ